jgi:hypothetical protein
MTGIYHKMKARTKNAKRSRRKMPPAPPIAREYVVVDRGAEGGKFEPEILDNLHARVMELGRAAAGDPDERRRDSESLLQLLLRGTVSPPVAIRAPMSPEEMSLKMLDMLKAEDQSVRFEARRQSRAKFTTYASYAGGVIAGSAAFAWGAMRIIGVPTKEQTFLDKLMVARGFEMAIDVVLVTAATLQTFADPSLTYGQKARTLAMGGLKLGKHAINFGLKTGLTYLFGGLMLSPLGAVVGVVLITGVLTGANAIVDATVNYVLFDHNAFEQKAAEQVVTDEFLTREFKGNAASMKKERDKSVSGVFMRAISGNSAVALAMMAVAFQVLDPYTFTLADSVVDKVAVNWIIVPRLIALAGRIYGSEMFARAVKNPASRAFGWMRRWRRFDTAAKWMEDHYVLMFTERVLKSVLKDNAGLFLGSYLRVGSLRSGIDQAYNAVWGVPRVNTPTLAALLDEAVAMDSHKEVLAELEARRAQMVPGVDDSPQARSALATEQQAADANISVLRAAVEAEGRQREVTAELSDTATFLYYKKHLEVSQKHHADATQALAFWNVNRLTKAEFSELALEPGGAAQLGHMATVMGIANLDQITWADVEKWRHSRTAYGLLQGARLPATPVAYKEEIAKRSQEIYALTASLHTTAEAEAEMVLSGAKTIAELRKMRSPWLPEVLTRFSTLNQFRNDPTGESASLLRMKALLHRIAEPSYTFRELQGDQEAFAAFISATNRVSDNGEAMLAAEPTQKDFLAWKESLTPEIRADWALWAEIAANPRAAATGTMAEEERKKKKAAIEVKTGSTTITPLTRGPSSLGDDPHVTTSGWSEASPPGVILSPQTRVAIEQGVRTGVSATLANMLSVNPYVARALAKTTDVLNGLFYGGLGAMASFVSGFYRRDPLNPIAGGGEGSPSVTKVAEKIGDLAAFGSVECLSTKGEYYLDKDPDSSTGALIPFLNGSPVSKNCYTKPWAMIASEITGQIALQGFGQAASLIGMPWATTFVNLVASARKSVYLGALQLILTECGNMHTAKLSAVPEEQRQRAAVCHLANLRMHDMCSAAGYSLQSALPDNPCSRIAIWVDARDIPKSLFVARKLFGGLAKAASASSAAVGESEGTLLLSGFHEKEIEEARSDRKKLADAAKIAIESGKSSWAMYFAKDPAEQEAIDVLMYGSEKISTARFSKTQLNSLDPQARELVEERLMALLVLRTENLVSKITMKDIGNTIAETAKTAKRKAVETLMYFRGAE